MKKQFFLLVMMLLSMAANAAVTINGIYYNLDYNTKTATVTSSSSKYTGAISIPASVTYNNNVYSVTSIGVASFYNCSSLISVTIPNSVTSIGESAFDGCICLTSVTIPSSVTSIGNSAFRDCSSLTSVTIGNSVTSIGSSAFHGCSNLTSVTIPNSVTSIGGGAFYGCGSLTSVTIPNSVTNIGDGTFSGCTGLASIKVESGNTVYDSRNNCNALIKTASNLLITGCKNTIIPNGVTGIEIAAFSDCSGLTSITIPNSVTSIGDAAFYDCSGLTSITIPNSVTSIGDAAFYGCRALTSITIPNGVTRIEETAFWGCESLTSITIPNSVTTIGKYAFQSCIGLTSITIPNSVTSIGDDAFDGCFGLTSIKVESGNTVYDSRNDCNAIIETASNILITGCMNTIIPNSVTSIGREAFGGCSGLTSITIPNSVTSIGDAAFYDCSGLTSITIPNSVTSIGYSAFSGCSGLTSITIPNSVTSIGDWAFDNYNLETVCSEIESPFAINENVFSTQAYAGTLYVPVNTKAKYQQTDGWKKFVNIVEPQTVENITFADANVKATCVANWDTNGDGELSMDEAVAVTDLGRVFSYKANITSFDELQYFVGLTSIGESAFVDCRSLTSISIPNSVTSIGEYAFYGCSGLTSVTIGNSVTSIGWAAFADCSGLTALTIPNSVTSIGSYAFDGCSGLTSVTIGNSVTSIGWAAFADCSGLTALTIPNSVTSIGGCAFYGCSGLTSVTIPNSVTSIGYDAFGGCSSLTSITIPNSVTSIGSSAFGGCSSLTSITIPNSVTSIGNYAFEYCSSLTSVTIPNSVTSIGEYAFYGCSGLTSVTIGNSVTSIGEYSFYGCSGLTSVTIGNSVTSIGKSAFQNCSSLTSISIPNSVTSIGEYAFYGCSGLTSVTIGNSVTSIGWAAFADCSGLTALTIPNSVTSIGDGAFYGCSGLTSVHINDLASWCGIAFGSSEANPLYYAHHLILNGTELKDLVVPTSVTSIGNYVFRGCSGLTSVTIPNSVASIGGSAFQDCNNLKTVYSEIESPFAINEDVFTNQTYAGTLYVPAGTKTKYQQTNGWNKFTNIVEPNKFPIPEYVDLGLPSGVCWAKWNMGSSSELDIPNTTYARFGWGDPTGEVDSASPSAYAAYEWNWQSKKDISGTKYDIATVQWGDKWRIPTPTDFTEISESSGYTTWEYGNWADSQGNSYPAWKVTSKKDPTKYIYFPAAGLIKTNGVSDKIRDYAYYWTSVDNGYGVARYAELMRDAYILSTDYGVQMPIRPVYGTPQTTNNITFADANVKTICVANWDTNGDGELSKDEAAAVTDLGTVFSNNANITSFDELQYFMGLTLINQNAFNGCTSLTSVTIPNSVKTIGEYAFSQCSSMSSVTIGSSITSIGNGVFSNCYGLTSIAIPNSVTSIGNFAFAYCNGLTSVTIPNSVTSIGGYTFAYCSGLTSVTIGKNVTSIGDRAFDSCDNLKTVYSEIESPFAINENVFSTLTYAGTLYVPANTKAKYLQTGGWKNFANIVDPEPTTYTLTITATGNGSASYDGTTVRGTTSEFEVTEGTTATITFTPDDGYRIKSVKVNGGTVSVTNNQYTVSSISANTTVSVEFEEIPPTIYTLSITATGNGSAAYNGTTVRGTTSTFEVTEGTSATITFTPDNGYRIKTVKVNGATVSLANNQYTISSITANTTVEVTFVEIPSGFIGNDLNYTVTSFGERQVKVTGGNYGNVLTVPATVTYEDETWKVVGIVSGTLANNSQLTAVIWEPEAAFTESVSNPNLLLYVKSAGYAPASIKNVVVNGTASNIILTDATNGNDFYCPQEFTARKISYTHNYSMATGIGESKGWESIALPFDVAKTTHASKGEIVPYQKWDGTDSKKPFWLMELGASGFVKANAIKANTPYIISMPNHQNYREDYRLNGSITFSAENVRVKRTDDLSQTSSGDKTFVPNFTNRQGTGIYALNVNNDYVTYSGGTAAGSRFVPNLRALHPFEAYMTSASAARTIVISDNMVTGIDDISVMIDEKAVVRVYLPSGQLVVAEKDKSLEEIKAQLPTGVYIVNGQKLIIK